MRHSTEVRQHTCLRFAICTWSNLYKIMFILPVTKDHMSWETTQFLLAHYVSSTILLNPGSSFLDYLYRYHKKLDGLFQLLFATKDLHTIHIRNDFFSLKYWQLPVNLLCHKSKVKWSSIYASHLCVGVIFSFPMVKTVFKKVILLSYPGQTNTAFYGDMLWNVNSARSIITRDCVQPVR